MADLLTLNESATDEELQNSLGLYDGGSDAGTDTIPDNDLPVVADPATEPTPEPTPEPEPTVEPTPAPEPEPTPTPEPQDARNWRVTAENAKDAEIFRIKKAGGEGFTLDDAIAVYQQRHPETAPNTTQEPDAVQSLKTRLTELDGIIDAAAEEQTLLTPEVAKAIKERGDLVADIRIKELESKQQGEREADAEARSRNDEFSTALDGYAAQAIELYPDCDNENSALSKAMATRLEAIAGNQKDPLFGLPSAPLLVAIEEAAKLKIAPKTGPAPSAEPAPQVNPQTQTQTKAPEATTPRVLPPVSGARSTPVTQVTEATKAADFKQKIDKATTSEEAAGLLAADLYADVPRNNDLLVFSES
jgi:hypothetical protein